MDEIFGYIERITFQNPENGYTVAQLKEPRKKDLTCIVGYMPHIQPGETVRCQGDWKNHLVHGRQFEITSCHTETPADLVGIKKYLGSGLIKGIGPKYAERITAFFKEGTLDVIDQNPEDLLKVPGIGEKRAAQIKSCWKDQKSIRDVMIFLQQYEVSPSFAQKIFKAYGEKSISVIKENPYQLARDIFGIGFKSADKIARKIGIEKESPSRIEAGSLFVLSELSNEGHVCSPLKEFIEKAEEVLEVSSPLIQEKLPTLKQDNKIMMGRMPYQDQEETFVWLKPLFFSEVGIAKEIRRLKASPSFLRQVDTKKAVEWAESLLNIQLAENQIAAVSKSLKEKIHIITGGPGTGKSTITKAILAITSKLTDKIILAAPTGRAAKRMSEVTGFKASTLHSLLEFDFRRGGFRKGREDPLASDLIIIDEASMIDTLLMYNLLKAIPDTSRVILIGDVNQLPSVGPGNVLKELIESKKISTTELNEIFRQAKGSQIITNAHLINQGYIPEIQNEPGSDFFFIEKEDPELILKEIISLVKERLPKKYHLDPIKDIQVLTPMRRGSLGADHLNLCLQEALNKASNPLFRAGHKYLVGDRVLQIKNNYQKNVFNGDMGIITKINQIDQELIVQIDEMEVSYDFSDLDELVLSYAISIHKSQGSEFRAVVIPLSTQHYMMLEKNLLYTAVTRGKKLVVVVGTRKALALAVKNAGVEKRYTGLKPALMGAISELL